MDKTSEPSATSTSNTEVVTEKHYLYYNVSLVLEEEKAKYIWINMEDTTSGEIKTTSLSVGRMQAHQLKLRFPFPFFGNKKTKLSFTRDGFISTMNSWMIHNKTHFIAPLKGLFDQKYSAINVHIKILVEVAPKTHTIKLVMKQIDEVTPNDVITTSWSNMRLL